MKKKAVEQLAEKRLRIIEGLERLLRERKKHIKMLTGENEGLRQTVQMLSGIILEGIERSGRVVISKSAISKGLKCGYTLTQTEDAYILEKVEKE